MISWAFAGSLPAQAEPDKISVSRCEDGAAIEAPFGRLLNNQWNRASAGPGAWRQCLRQRTTAGGITQYGWAWHWPDKPGLYAYPEVMVGRSPWREEPSTDVRFPRLISATSKLRIRYDFTIRSSGRQNLSTDLWITSQAPPDKGPPDPSIIKAELMIWTHASPGLIDSKTKPLAEVTVDGRPWTLYARPTQIDPQAKDGPRWMLISYHSKSDFFNVTIDAAAFLRDAVSRGLILSSDTVCGVELGNEIVNGVGTTWIQAFEVAVE